MCLLPCLCTLAFYRLLLLVVHTVELLTEVAAADFTGNDHKSFGTQFTIQMLDKIAFALHANCLNFYSIYERAGAAENIMRTLFWLEESNMGRVQLVQTTPNTLPEKHDDRLRAIEDTTLHYNPSDDWPVCPPVAIYFDCIVDSFMRERSHRLLSGAKTNKDKQKTALLNFVVQQSGFTCPLQLFSAILFRLT